MPTIRIAAAFILQPGGKAGPERLLARLYILKQS